MERKSVVCEFKARKTPGEFDALFSVIGNIDLDGDRIHKGAFAPAESADPNPAVVWTHMWNVPPIGETLEWGETADGAKATGRLFLEEHEVAKQVWKGLETGALKQFSFAFDMKEISFTEPDENESSPRWDGKIREIRSISRVFEWGPTLLGANPETEMMSAKSLVKLLGLKELGLQPKQDDVLDISAVLTALKSGSLSEEQQAELAAALEPEAETEETADEAWSAEVATLLSHRPMRHLHS